MIIESKGSRLYLSVLKQEAKMELQSWVFTWRGHLYLKIRKEHILLVKTLLSLFQFEG
jgi:hypothetical protein